MIDPNEKIRFVELTKYNAEWANIFTVAANEIKSILQENCIQIHHIGSTAIPNIYAKPIVDVLPVVKDISLVDSLNHEFEKLGYICMGEYGISGRRFYWKSKTKRTLNIHLFEKGAPELTRNLLFKDFMLKHDDYAQAYSLVKQSLAEVFPQDIENYVNGKSSFVQMINYKTGSAKSIQLNAKDNLTIEPYNPVWPKLAKAEIKAIKGMAGQLSYISIEHRGSTAFPGVSSIPIIEILIILQSMTEAKHWIKLLETLAYVFSEENSDKSDWIFSKGMPPFGEKRTHHVHIVETYNKII